MRTWITLAPLTALLQVPAFAQDRPSDELGAEPSAKRTDAPAECAPLPSAPGQINPSEESNWLRLDDDLFFGPPNSPATSNRPIRGLTPLGPNDPWHQLEKQLNQTRTLHDQMFRDLERQMLQFGGAPGFSSHSFSVSTRGGDLVDEGDHYEITLEIDGLDNSSTQLSVNGNQLVFQCTCNQSITQTDPNGRSQSQAAFTNNIQRRWTLPNDVDRSKIEASDENGAIRIRLPKLDDTEAQFEVTIH